MRRWGWLVGVALGLAPTVAIGQSQQETWAGVTTFAVDYAHGATPATALILEVDGATDEAALGAFVSGTFTFAPRVIGVGVHTVRARACAALAGMADLCSAWSPALTVTARPAVMPLAPTNLRATVVVVTP